MQERNILEQWTLFSDGLCLFEIKADDVIATTLDPDCEIAAQANAMAGEYILGAVP
jgi:hypothetical protein